MADSLRPAINATLDERASILAKTRCLRLLNAIVGNGLGGRAEPPTADELQLPPECLIDPFTGKPLAVRRLADGWLLYAAGADLVDDGGSLADGRDIGLAPPTYRTDDSSSDVPSQSATEEALGPH